MDGFVQDGKSCELNIKTGKGHVFCKLANITNASQPQMHATGALVPEKSKGDGGAADAAKPE